MDHASYLREIEPDVRVRRNSFGPISYQDHLYALVRRFRPSIVVETGTRYGVATSFIYDAAVQNVLEDPSDDIAHLYSCDPMHSLPSEAAKCVREYLGVSIPADFWTFYPETSRTALPKIPVPPLWDMFIHDSDHSAENMAWELTYAWGRLRHGGVIVCDDWITCMHAEKHDVAQKFIALHGLDAHEIGSAFYAVKE